MKAKQELFKLEKKPHLNNQLEKGHSVYVDTPLFGRILIDMKDTTANIPSHSSNPKKHSNSGESK